MELSPESLLTDEQWEKIEPMLPGARRYNRGRKPRSNRNVVNGILWVLRTGNRWQDLPPTHPSPSTCQRRLRKWMKEGVWVEIWQAYIRHLTPAMRADWGDAFADGSFLADKSLDHEDARSNAARARDEWRQVSSQTFWTLMWKPRTYDVRRKMAELALVVHDSLMRRKQSDQSDAGPDDPSGNGRDKAANGLPKARRRTSRLVRPTSRTAKPARSDSAMPKATRRMSSYADVLNTWRNGGLTT